MHTALRSYILNSEPKRKIREITQQNVEVPELYAEISKNCYYYNTGSCNIRIGDLTRVFFPFCMFLRIIFSDQILLLLYYMVRIQLDICGGSMCS